MVSMADVASITPVYATDEKHVSMLYACLKSLVGQVGEIVVWDDGSTLSLDSVIQSFPEVLFLGGDHKGKSCARNMAVRSCHKKFIYPVDADDEIVDKALRILTRHWTGMPLYSDILKVRDGIEQPYVLLPFDCTEAKTKCIASVNVLHTVEQWDAIGGWNEDLNLYEDFEYNSRLFWMYCAKKVSSYLVRYRQHDLQSTHVAGTSKKSKADAVAKQSISDFINQRGKIVVGCCGKRTGGNRRSRSAATPGGVPTMLHSQSVQRVSVGLDDDISSMGDPGPGKVWAKYFFGRGMGPHDKRGSRSRKKYRRVKYGGIYAVNAADAVTREEYEKGAPNCGFVQMQQIHVSDAAPPTVAVSRTPVAEITRSPVREVEKVPVADPQLEEYKKQLSTFSIRELRDLVKNSEFSIEDVTALLAAENASDNARIGAAKVLQKEIDRLTS